MSYGEAPPSFRPGFLWVKIISRQGADSWTVREANHDVSVVYGNSDITGVKIANPGGGEPTVPSTKAFPAYWDREGELVFFFNQNERNTTLGEIAEVRASDPNTNFEGAGFFNFEAEGDVALYLKFGDPLTVNSVLDRLVFTSMTVEGDLTSLNAGGVAWALLDEDGAVNLATLLYDASVDVHIKLVTADYDPTTLTFNTQPTLSVEYDVAKFRIGGSITVTDEFTTSLAVDIVGANTISIIGVDNTVGTDIGEGNQIHGIKVYLSFSVVNEIGSVVQLKFRDDPRGRYVSSGIDHVGLLKSL